MHRTLFLIPHEIGPLPLFGIGWLLILLGAGFFIRMVVAHRQWVAFQNTIPTSESAGDQANTSLPRPPSPAEVLKTEGWFWLLAGIVVAVFLPNAELQNVDGQPVGLAVRSYGAFVVMGLFSAIGLAMYRAKQRGLPPETITSLIPWVFVPGIVGARMFYVIQYRQDYIQDNFIDTLKRMASFTEGGLVVYGSMIGGFLGYLIFSRIHRLSMLRMGDVLIPCLFLGVFLGRIGCLMNGCCYGGACEPSALSVQFPPNSPVYKEQLASGSLLGMQIDPETNRIDEVQPSSVADTLGITAGQTFERGNFDPRTRETADRAIPEEDVPLGWGMQISGRYFYLSPDDLPAKANPVVAAQVISSLTALVLCISLCVLDRFIAKDGVLLFSGFAGYAVIRFILEIVRVDEGGQLGTSFSISQWVSMVVFALCLTALAIVLRKKPNSDSLVTP